MKIRDKIIIKIAKLTRFLLKLTNHKATSLPGKVAYSLNKDILSVLGENTKFIFVTGTNGKTMTTHYVTNILKKQYEGVYTNDSGSNMIQGIITVLLDNPVDKNTVAVLEVDEANLVKISEFLKPDYVILTNLFRDQEDRFTNVKNVYDKIMDGLDKCEDVQIIANGDLPMFSHEELKKYNPIYYGIREDEKSESNYILEAEESGDGILCPNCNEELRYKLLNYSSLGDFDCPKCDFKAPKLSYSINNILAMDANYSNFMLNCEEYEIQVGGLYNIYNALSAIALAKELGMPYEKIYEGLKEQEHVFGRQEVVEIEGKEIIINLVKNPTGLNQIIDLMLLEKEPITLYSLLNNNVADGTDVSWVEEVYYEKLDKLDIRSVKVSGMEKEAMKERLERANIYNGEIIEFDYEKEIVEEIKKEPTKKIYILTTYTAMLKLREVLGL